MQRVAVTGGATGMGAATVQRLLERGAEVHVLDVAAPARDAVAFHECDLGERERIDAAIAALPERLDALVNVAGIAGPEPAEQVVRVNFLGLRHLTEALTPRIVDGGGVVNVASVAGQGWQRRFEVVDALLRTPDFDAGVEWLRANEDKWAKDPYTFSKQCVVAYTFRAAGAALERRVRVNCVSPGAVGTRLTPAFRAQMGDDQYAWSVAQIGEARPEDVAPVIEWLAVGECGWLNGVDIPVDGGFTAGALGGWIDVASSPAALARKARRGG